MGDQIIYKNLYEYLDKHEVLQTNDDEKIKAAKKKYWNQVYKRQWKKNKLKDHTRFEILLNPNEVKSIRKQASLVGISKTRYIKEAALNQKVLINPKVVGKIREVLMLSYDHLENIFAKGAIENSIRDDVLSCQLNMEKEILKLLNSNAYS